MLCLVFLSSITVFAAHALSSNSALGVEISREGNLMLRRNAEEDQSGQAKPMYGRRAAEAQEAFKSPTKIDDSPLANWSLKMPDFIDRYPLFYTGLFVAMGLAVFAGVCVKIYMEDKQAEENRQRRAIATARKQVAQAAAFSQKRAAAFAPRPFHIPEVATVPAAMPGARRPLNPTPKAVAAATRGELAKITKLNGWRSQDTTSASGETTPRSSAPSQATSEGSRPPAISVIRNGTVLVARVPEVIFASSTSWKEIGELTAGQQVIAAGPPEMADDYTMVPIKPRGAVDLKVLQVQRGADWQ